MKKTILVALFAFCICGVVSHYLALSGLPKLIMAQAIERIESNGAKFHQWVASPKITPKLRSIVRPSPDLSYSVCLFDISTRPITLSVPRSSGYGSLSVFQADTENVFVGSLDGDGTLEVTVSLEGQTDTLQENAVTLNSAIGIALVRRIATSQEAYDRSVELTSTSSCAPVL
ncbi:MAG: DUF1254 domain-containing protein [Pseudomonadota bacterium]